jgi:hypothetical protein
VAQGARNPATDATFGPARRDLELDLEQVEPVHAEHSHRFRAGPCEFVVLQAVAGAELTYPQARI